MLFNYCKSKSSKVELEELLFDCLRESLCLEFRPSKRRELFAKYCGFKCYRLAKDAFNSLSDEKQPLQNLYKAAQASGLTDQKIKEHYLNYIDKELSTPIRNELKRDKIGNHFINQLNHCGMGLSRELLKIQCEDRVHRVGCDTPIVYAMLGDRVKITHSNIDVDFSLASVYALADVNTIAAKKGELTSRSVETIALALNKLNDASKIVVVCSNYKMAKLLKSKTESNYGSGVEYPIITHPKDVLTSTHPLTFTTIRTVSGGIKYIGLTMVFVCDDNDGHLMRGYSEAAIHKGAARVYIVSEPHFERSFSLTSVSKF